MITSLLLQNTVTPWFEPATFGTYFGAIGGAAVGILGALLGSLGSVWANKGVHRTLVLGAMLALGVAGALLFLTGLAGLFLGQPYGVWYPLTLIGGMAALLFLGLRPVMRRRYDQAETRRMQAEELRRA